LIFSFKQNRTDTVSSSASDLQHNQSSFKKQQTSTELSLADKLKLQQLREKFKDLDPDVLQSIFQQQNCLLEPTLNVLKTVYQVNVPDSEKSKTIPESKAKQKNVKKTTTSQKVSKRSTKGTKRKNSASELKLPPKLGRISQQDVLGTQSKHPKTLIHRMND
jgi:hypothetical protein